jgi:hypothetical protein
MAGPPPTMEVLNEQETDEALKSVPASPAPSPAHPGHKAQAQAPIERSSVQLLPPPKPKTSTPLAVASPKKKEEGPERDGTWAGWSTSYWPDVFLFWVYACLP